MQCDKCRNEAVFFQPYSGRHLCGRHLAADIEARAKRSIRSHRWMSPGDHIAVIRTGDRKSAALLHLLKKTHCRSPGYPAQCHSWRVRMRRTGAARPRSLKSRGSPRFLLPGYRSREVTEPLHTTSPQRLRWPSRWTISHQEVLAQFLFGNAEHLIHPPRAAAGGIPVICPFIAIPSEELDCYLDVSGNGDWSCVIPAPAESSLTGGGDPVPRLFPPSPGNQICPPESCRRTESGNAAGIAADVGRGRPGSAGDVQWR